MYYYFGLIVIGVLVVWSLGSYLVIRKIEEPKYVVVENKNGYEIREYSAYITAQTEVTGTYTEATSKGFRIIADYIFGNNVTKSSIAMTAPVLENSSQKIAMTVPVLDTERGTESRIISFVLPSEYTMETLPKPNNSQVELISVPSRKVAVLTFTWYPTVERIALKKKELQSLLEKDGVQIAGDTQVARYNPPLSMPLMLRNEIIIPIQ